MNIALWIVQSLLAAAFLAAGVMKMITPVETLAENMAWVTHAPAMAVKVIGLVEFLGALGLILPSVLKIKPALTPLAAAGLVLTMIGAAATHIAIGEANMIAPNFVLGGLAAFVAWGRHNKLPIAAK